MRNRFYESPRGSHYVLSGTTKCIALRAIGDSKPFISWNVTGVFTWHRVAKMALQHLKQLQFQKLDDDPLNW